MRRGTWVLVAALAAGSTGASAQCAPAPDSSYFFRDLTQRRADARRAEDRAFFEKLVSATFANRAAFIEGELAADRGVTDQPVIAVRNFSLVEHRKGFVVTSYRFADHWFRDVYQVEDGQWRLASTEPAAPARQAGGT